MVKLKVLSTRRKDELLRGIGIGDELEFGPGGLFGDDGRALSDLNAWKTLRHAPQVPSSLGRSE
ncbi:MAG TPA: hypothetical protein VNO52_14375 [Methylomirabilota bacterium]|nr:hypothetical protein [Methylomirabilota bacterium]